MTAARLIVTAETPGWARTAGQVATGYAASRHRLRRRGRHRARAAAGRDARRPARRQPAASSPSAATPCRRPSSTASASASSPARPRPATTACPSSRTRAIRIGGNLRFFGDGCQISKKLDGRRYWRLPVMDGEFVCEDVFGTIKGVAGGNFLILGREPGRRLWRRPRRRSRPSARCRA